MMAAARRTARTSTAQATSTATTQTRTAADKDLRVQQILKQKAGRDRELERLMQRIKELDVVHTWAEDCHGNICVG